MQKKLLIILFLTAFTAVAYFIENADGFKDTKTRLQKITLPSTPTKLGKRATLLEQFGLVYVFPKDYSKYYDPITGESNFDHVISLESPLPEYHQSWIDHRQIPPEAYPSSKVLDPDITASGLPILSVVVADKDLNDPETGIIANRKRKGKEWERPCFISYYYRGQLLFASGAGIRIHGGSKNKRPMESLRFYFRKAYGHDQFKPGIIFDNQSVPIKRVITRIENRYANLLALDLAQRIGCLTPAVHPVVVYLNGKQFGNRYALIEHLNKDWLRSRYGHDDFILLRTTGHPEKRRISKSYQKLKKWLYNTDIRMTMREAGKKVDIENLSLWFISQFFTAGNDMYQGPLLRDRTKPDARWFWVNWDMDQSFVNPYEDDVKILWQQRLNLHNVIRNPERDRKNPRTARFQNKDPRAILFRRLSSEDPAYKTYFERLLMDTLNHKINPAYLDAWLDRQREAILALNTDDQDFFQTLAAFLHHRPAYLREMMRTHYDSAESHRCRVNGPTDLAITIDGYPSELPYNGWYFEGSQITLSIDPDKHPRLIGWRIDDRIVHSAELPFSHTVMAPVRIEAIFQERSHD